MCGCECLHVCERKWEKGKEIYGEKQVQELQEEREYETKTCQQFSYRVQVLHSACQEVHTNTHKGKNIKVLPCSVSVYTLLHTNSYLV